MLANGIIGLLGRAAEIVSVEAIALAIAARSIQLSEIESRLIRDGRGREAWPPRRLAQQKDPSGHPASPNRRPAGSARSAATAFAYKVATSSSPLAAKKVRSDWRSLQNIQAYVHVAAVLGTPVVSGFEPRPRTI